MPDKNIPGKAFDFIGELSLRGQHEKISSHSSATEETFPGGKIDLKWPNMRTIIALMMNHPDFQILSNLPNLIGLANAAPSAL
jgi:hypothetical protein